MRWLLAGIILFVCAVLAAFIWLIACDHGEIIVEGRFSSVEVLCDGQPTGGGLAHDDRLVLRADRYGSYLLNILVDGRPITCTFTKNAKEDIRLRIEDGLVRQAWFRGSDLVFWQPLDASIWGGPPGSAERRRE